jgi:hypothetical protein
MNYYLPKFDRQTALDDITVTSLSPRGSLPNLELQKALGVLGDDVLEILRQTVWIKVLDAHEEDPFLAMLPPKKSWRDRAKSVWRKIWKKIF